MNNNSFTCAIILGASASGKSALASHFAHSCTLLSADSLCVYKDLSIISAKPTENYYGIDLCELNQEFSVGDWLNEFKKAKQAAIAQNQALIIVGGSSFYLASLLKGLSPAVPRLKEFLSNPEIAKLMQQIDPQAKIDPNDTYRLQRWLEIYSFTHQAPSIWLANNRQEPLLSADLALIVELVSDKSWLNERINQRSKMMLENGAILECAKALSKLSTEASGNCDDIFALASANKALNCIGAKQICEQLLSMAAKLASTDFIKLAQILQNDESKLNALCEEISLRTRQYAKRQRTFNKSLNATALNASAPSADNAKFIADKLGIKI